MQGKNKILGKGLSALISDNFISNYENSNTSSHFINVEVPIDIIEPNPWQPRKVFVESELIELRDSIIEHGIIQPIALRKKHDKYQIVVGERRWQASKLAGKSTIPAILVDYTDKQMLEAALVENIQRQDLNPIDEAKAFKAMIVEYSYTQEQISKKVGKSRSFIANSVRLLSLPIDVQDKLISGKLSSSHARTLVGKENASDAAKKIIEEKLNVRDAENLSHRNRDSIQSEHLETSDLIQIQQSLTESLGMKVKIKDSYSGGSLTINFVSMEQLDTLVQKLSSNNLLF